MVVTRSQSGLEESGRVFNEPPQSPSASTAAHAVRAGNPASAPAPAPQPVTRSPDALPTIRPVREPYRTRLAEHSEQPTATGTRSRTARSTRSTASAIARLRFEAEERLAAIRRQELQIEAELVKKRLAADLAELEDDDSAQEEEPTQNIERVHAWLDETTPKATLTERREAIADSAPEQSAVDVPAPQATDTADVAAAMPGATTPAARGRRIDWTPHLPESRRRSPTPRGRGIEQLATTLEKMMSSRPPPRQTTDLPLFSGTPREWVQFAAAMRETTRIYKFTPTENIARLRNCLRGEARDIVAPLLSAATHPDVVMKTLEQCFGRPEILVDLALEDIRRLPRLGTTATELNAFAVKVQNVVAVLNNVEQSYLHNPMLVREVLEKISPHLKSRWCDYAEEHPSPATIATLATFLMREADRALRHGYSSTSQPKREPPRPAAATASRPEAKKKPVYATTAANEDVICCPACEEPHALTECAKFKKMQYDDRWEVVKKQGLCFKCIASRHRRYNCKKKACGVNGCRRPHHKLLHGESDHRAASNITTAATPAAATDNETATVTATATRSDIKLKICPVTVSGNRGSIETFALFDEGSTITLVDDDLARQIGADGPTTCLQVKGIGNEHHEIRSRRVKISLRGIDGRDFRVTARTMPSLNLTPQSISAEVLRMKHLSDLDADGVVYSDAKPRVLIGTDNWQLIVTRELRCGGANEPAASRTELGWVLHGATPSTTLRRTHNVLHVASDDPADADPLTELVARHFEIDALGVSLTSQHITAEDKRAVHIFESTVRYNDGHYEVGLPWRRDNAQLPPSFNAALKRLRNLEAKLEKDPNEKEQYHAKIRHMLARGYAEPCDGTEDASPVAWYLPHFAVRNINKPGKVRVVLDAAAKTHGTCLNDHLLPGPDMLRSLNSILYRFREGTYAVTADIEDMFMRVKIRKEDQPAQMFLWRDRPTDPPGKFKMTSMIFGASSSPFLAHSVRDKNARAHADTHPAALRPITESHYMDDFVESFSDLSQAKEVIKQVDEVHRRASFHLRGWNSNNAELLAATPEDRRAQATTTQLGGTEKMLGLLWDAGADSLSFNIALNRVPDAVRTRTRAPTKREALSTVMSIYDPLGLLSCYTITAKITLQKLWRHHTAWDEPVPEEVAADFDAWLAGLQTIGRIRVPRSYDGGSDVRRRELHVFCDASEDAFATVAYWRLQLSDGSIKTALVAAKAKVAPLKTQTVPRLELQAALIGARLAQNIKEQHRVTIDSTHYWSDSQTVLHWLRNGSRRYTPFVAHRLGEITEISKAIDWRWVPTHLNVADFATRSGYMPQEDDVWFSGPEFLQRPKSDWPQWEPCQEETREEEVHVATQQNDTGLPDIERFSSYDRLIGATAQVLLFPQRCKNHSVLLGQEHLQRATQLWIKRAQQDSFPDELRELQRGNTVSRASPLRRFHVKLEDGLLKIDGRANKADIPEETKNPIVLHGRHAFTKLLIARAHKRAGHANPERVVNDLRQQFFIVRLRPTVKAITASCQMCRLRKKPPTSPPTGDLPAERLRAFQRPFSCCGLDYFGPMTVTIGRRREKRWGALFTCLTTRAVHLELVASLTTDSAILALRRMAARRGWPAVIYSDNATNFKGADAELRKAYSEWLPGLNRASLTYGTAWKYIAPGAPNQGGAWERLVRSVKTALSMSLHEKAPKEEVLATLLTEAEHSINSRPLTHVPVDPHDPEALTPNHFLLGSSTGLPCTGPCEEADRRTWRAAQGLADDFWRRWLREYLPTIVPRPTHRGRQEELQVGDVVIIADSTLPRNTWPRGIVTQTFPGPDGVVRNVDVKTTGGTFRRPATKLIRLHTALSPDQRERTRCTLLSTKDGCGAPSPEGGC